MRKYFGLFRNFLLMMSSMRTSNFFLFFFLLLFLENYKQPRSLDFLWIKAYPFVRKPFTPLRVSLLAFCVFSVFLFFLYFITQPSDDVRIYSLRTLYFCVKGYFEKFSLSSEKIVCETFGFFLRNPSYLLYSLMVLIYFPIK